VVASPPANVRFVTYPHIPITNISALIEATRAGKALISGSSLSNEVAMAYSRELESIKSELTMESAGFIAASLVALVLIGVGACGVFVLSVTGALDRAHSPIKNESAAGTMRHSIHVSRVSR
jgi:hypothetical protein